MLAYDGVAAVGALIAEARPRGGSPFSTALTQPPGFAGANGAFRFCPNGPASAPRDRRGPQQRGA